jgi:hypothetical protein
MHREETAPYISTLFFFYGSIALVAFGRFFTSLIYTQSVPLPTHKTTQTQNKPTQTFMPVVGLELTIPMFERVKTVYVLDGAATVIGRKSAY